jgi:non-ribosomal peptide synthetase component F
MSTRDSLITYLQTVLDDTEGLGRIQLVKTPRAVDKLSRPALVVKTDSLEKLPAAPIGNMLGNFLLTLVSNHLDMEKAEDQLDDLLELLLPALFTHNIVWTRATQVGYDEQHIAYDIAVATIIK